MNHTITPTGWLTCGKQRVKLATIDRYEDRGLQVILYGVTGAVAFEFTDAEGADAFLAVLDAHFTPPTP